MQRLDTLTALTLLTLLIPAAAASAAEQTLTLEPEATQVTFLLPATGHDVEGRLYLQSGEIAFDPATGAAWGEIRIDATRAETGHKKRDKKMHVKVLESARFPSIVFVPERLEGELAASGSSDVVLVGNVTIHGAAHPLTLPTRVTIDGDRATAETTFKVPYVAWGMHDPSILFLKVSQEVEVSIHAAGAVTPMMAAAGSTAAAVASAQGDR